jgi:TonB family protein
MRKLLACMVVAVLASGSITFAQQAAPASNSARKVMSRVEPIYPELAKRMRMRGMVKLEVAVRANGSVKSTKVLGGSPVLALAAGDAVVKWKFEPGPNETTETVQITFESNNE